MIYLDSDKEKSNDKKIDDKELNEKKSDDKKSNDNKLNLRNKIQKIKNSTMLGISVMVVLVLLVAVTVTWFVFNLQTNIKGNSLQVSDWDFIVSKTTGGPRINDGDTIDLLVDDFTNVTTGVMAPGTTGSIKLFVKTTSDVVTSCNITLDKSQLTLKVDDSNDYSEILQNHICFYKDAQMTQKISMEDAYTFDLTKGEEKEVNIYWKWPYEGDEIMPDTITDEADQKAFLRKYDDEDCIISKYRNKIDGSIELQISGTSKKPES